MIDRMTLIDNNIDKINELIDKVNYLESELNNQLSDKEKLRSKIYDMIIDLEEEIRDTSDMKLIDYEVIQGKIDILRKVMNL